MDVTLSPQAIALVVPLLGTMATVIVTLCGVVGVLYRESNKRSDAGWQRLIEASDAGWQRLIDERDARMIDLFRNLEEKEIRIKGLEHAQDRYYQLAADSTATLREVAGHQRSMS